jgi:uncharacterized membrane protein
MRLLKTATFTTMHITIAFTIVWLMTGSVMVGGAVALIEPLCNAVGYFLHERLWERFRRRRERRVPAGTAAAAA